ncbi:SpdA protein [Streptomyces sp. NPDC050658]|uniref:SpdA protein n=1 Tax=unclassified Streptomyces TaxID=2593676 RepID=UPI0034345738
MGGLNRPLPGARLGLPLEQRFTLRAVTVIAGTVVGLTFLFGFGNVWTLALSLGVPPWVAPLVAPAVDLSVVGLLLAIRHMALHGAGRDQMRPARRLLIFSSAMTLALNVAAPLLAGQLGKAAFDAVGPLLLIGWAEVGPGLLQTLNSQQFTSPSRAAAPEHTNGESTIAKQNSAIEDGVVVDPKAQDSPDADLTDWSDDLFERARREDALHWEAHMRPISAETLRKRLRVGTAKARLLVTMVRTEQHRSSTDVPRML